MTINLDEWEKEYIARIRVDVVSMGIDDSTLSDDACFTLRLPWDAPENFYCDGEVSHKEAKARWVRMVERDCGKLIADKVRNLI